MTKIEAPSLEQAYKDATVALSCSITELNIEVVQSPSNGFFGLFRKNAIIVAAKKISQDLSRVADIEDVKANIEKKSESNNKQEIKTSSKQEAKNTNKQKLVDKVNNDTKEHEIINDTIMPQSFVSTQDDEDYDMSDINFTADYEEEHEDQQEEVYIGSKDLNEIAAEVEKDINKLFNFTCFDIDTVDVRAYDENTLLIEFKGKDAALLIGKEGYRYKALSYMIFNWINTKYQLQLRLEIAEFLKNQEESVSRYLIGVYESIDRDGRCQTKILDGVLIQIALRELREKYSDKYVAIRSTRDGLKYIIINDYHSN